MTTECRKCRWLDEPDTPHKWHTCNWPVKLPKAIVRHSWAAVSITDDTFCPAFETRDSEVQVYPV
jgi:hypothetical protein